MSISTVITLGYGSFGNTGYVITLGYDTSAIPPVPPPPPAAGTTIGGVERWYDQLPRLPQKKEIVFRRNMEQRDREDIDDVASILRRLT